MEAVDKPLINRVAESSLITVNLEDLFPAAPILEFDLKDFLFHGLILKEKDFRIALTEYNWQQVEGAHLAVFCSTDAIIPTWAYMLVAIHARPHAREIYLGTKEQFLDKYYSDKIADMDCSHLKDAKVVIKGCSQRPVPPSAYLDLAKKIQPIVQSLMYGEPCSTVPLFKRTKAAK